MEAHRTDPFTPSGLTPQVGFLRRSVSIGSLKGKRARSVTSALPTRPGLTSSQPCTLRDFMNYLVHVERSAENLQFFLWYRDYERRFAAATTADLSLAPEWTQEMEDGIIARLKKEHADKIRRASKDAGANFGGADFEKGNDKRNGSEMVADKYHQLATRAFASAGAKDPFRIQPFRKEVDRIIANYIMDGAPRQLNLSEQEQKTVLQALSYTTHPSAFRVLVRLAEATLREQSHPNFIWWSVCNGNPPRLEFALVLGVATVLAGVAVAVILTLSGAGRGYRALAAIAWVAGFATVMAAHKGMCVILHGLHHRHIRPWELFDSEPPEDDRDGDPIDAARRSLDRSGSHGSYEDEPWVIRYRKRHMLRKIFDREVQIEEPALRRIQDTIIARSFLFALICAAILTAVFVALPSGGFF
ncbi:inorganic pyrophosphatase-like protein [Thermothelomyces heterothallicus CBS 202.75]|uniref:inorganic pyrophosphatase-like protein n=1 Tax=Thermothelomyces heterothallicus CBS 202.75 TaxID=1149848 RepID=UPI0037448089